jgi:hypothetical protein
MIQPHLSRIIQISSLSRRSQFLHHTQSVKYVKEYNYDLVLHTLTCVYAITPKS